MFSTQKPRTNSIALTALLMLLLSIQSLPSASATARSCAQGGVCVVGNTGPGGGKVFYVDGSGIGFSCGPTLTSTCMYLEYSTSLSGSGIKWSVTALTSTEIGITASGTAIGTGYKNTLAIINQQGAFNASTNKYEAGAAQAFNGGGKTDWYQPSKDELTALHASLASLPLAQQNLGFVNASTEFNATSTWGIWTPVTTSVIASGIPKSDPNITIPIRAFTISPSTAPSAPTLTSVTAGDRQISITFTEDLDNGSAFTDYEYSLNGATYVSAATTTSPFTISGLSGRTSYSVTLKARNSVGLGSPSGSLSATTTDSSADASEAAAAAAEAARVVAAEAARVAAAEAARVNASAEAAKKQKELSELLSVIPSIAGLALNIGDLTNSLLLKQKCVKGKATKLVKKGAKCPTGYVKRK